MKKIIFILMLFCCCIAGFANKPELMPADICQILEETSVKLTPTKSNLTGIGRVDALAAVLAVSEWDAVNENYNTEQDETDLSNASIQVIDMNGRMVLSRKGANLSNATENLSPGIYILRMITNNQVKTQKIVIR